MDILKNVSESLNEYLVNNSIGVRELSERTRVSQTVIRACLNRVNLLNIKNTLQIADFIPCSLEYLVGNTDEILDFTLIPRTPFYDNLNLIMRLQNIKRSDVLKKDGKIDYTYFYRWKKGELPQLETLYNLAKYLNCTMDMLMGRERIPDFLPKTKKTNQ